MNVQKLKDLAEYIKKEPVGFDMETFGSKEDSVPCGTTCCIGGTAVLLNNPRLYLRSLGRDVSIKEEAQKILGLTGAQADRLFYFKSWEASCTGEGWPRKFEDRYNQAVTTEEHARVAVDRIRHFIKTKGRE